MKRHASVTDDRIFDACEVDDYVGFCIACGEEQQREIKPDARDYICESCSADQVFGVEELLFC